MADLTFGQWLKERREALGMSLRDVEKATGGEVSNATLSMIETGRTERPAFLTVVNLAVIYGIHFEELMERARLGNRYEPPALCPTCGRAM